MIRAAALRLALAPAVLAATGCADADPLAPEPGVITRAVAQPIVGGQIDEQTKGAVGLAVNLLGLYFIGHCSGTLIAPNLVLTAQHCVALTQDEAPGGGVVCGKTDFGTTAGGAIFRVTTQTVRPTEDGPAFHKGAEGPVFTAPGTDNLCGFDVALIVLEGAGVPAKEATPIVPRIDAVPEPGEQFSAIGYGLTEPDGGSSGTRMRIDGNLVKCVGEGCKSAASIKPSEWKGNSPTCPGDSGGPALDGEGRVMGVLSRGPSGCISSVYGGVSAWKDFIVQTALAAAEAGGIDPPFWAVTGSSAAPPPAGPGESCLGFCTEGHVCARARPDDAARVCLAACDPAAPACPARWQCDPDVGACVPEPAAPEPADEEDGCALAAAGPRSSGGAGWFALAVAAAAAACQRRRRIRAFHPACLLGLLLSCSGPAAGSIGALLSRDNATGAVHVREAPDGLPAHEAGLLPGDRIKMIDGVLVDDLGPDEVRRLLRGEVGSKVELTIVRGEEVLRVELRRGPLRQGQELGPQHERVE
ncbi:MAG: trypsin-like serine protease [Deltaproteobacteria bacterium]|nr:trypsin-like serine protease [Deltaproteobacteria bacterium]